MNNGINWPVVLNECFAKVREKVVSTAEKPIHAEKGQVRETRGAGGDIIEEVDIAAENAIVNTIKSHDISFTLISEESGTKKFGKHPEETFVSVDPVDGTTNRVRGIPFYATSIAVSEKPILSEIHTAMVGDLLHSVIYSAQKGKGAFRNGRRIVPRETKPTEDAIIGLDLNSYRVDEFADRLTALITSFKHIRHLGANGLELCYVADGITDAFVDIRGKLRTTDLAGAWLILKEAKGVMTTANGQPIEVSLDPQQRISFVASRTDLIHKKILALITS